MFEIRTRIGLFGVAGMLVGVSPALGQNLLLNGSLEVDGPGFVLFQDWGNFNNVFSDESVEVAAQDGVQCAKMYGTFIAEGQSDNGIFQVVSVTEGTEYELSAWTYVNAEDALLPLDTMGSAEGGNYGHLALLIIDFRNAAGDNISSAQVQVYESGVTPNDQWNQFSLTATAPTGAVQAQVTPLLIQWDLAPGAIFWDNISLTVVEAGGCNGADLAEPYGSLDFSDVLAFLVAFGNMDAAADLAAPMGSWDFSDVLAFLTQFGNGCP
ncbi:MAG: GC-type dockerin domain-anchored protein [Phycisphaerales bacterium]